MRPKESILIEQVSNGFIVSPKEIMSFTKNSDVYVFADITDLKIFLEKHFSDNGVVKTGEAE